MRVWLVDHKEEMADGLAGVLRQLEKEPATGLQLVGASPFQPDFLSAMRKLVPDLLDVVVLQESCWPEGPWTEELLQLGPAVLVAAAADRHERFRCLASRYPLLFVPPHPAAEVLWAALVSTFLSSRRDLHWKDEVDKLQQRLQDRIVIERAKGVLVQRLHITEEEAYKRLRLQSRRQRRQIRDIAQSLLDTQFLFLPEHNGFEVPAGADAREAGSPLAE